MEVVEGAMTVFLFCGTPGSGKSLHMAKNIYWRVKLGKPTICNFGINPEMFKSIACYTQVENEQLSPELLYSYAENYFENHPFKEGSIALYIDECQVIFGNREWRNADRSAWIRFFTQHRKLGYDVYLVAQQHEMIDKQIRALVEYQVMHRKLNNSGWVGRLAHVLFIGHPVICAVTSWYGMKMRLSAEWMLGTSKYYRLYDTRKIFRAYTS